MQAPTHQLQTSTQLTDQACDDPDAPIDCCFRNMPQPLTSTMTMAELQEPGERLVLSGTVYQPDGKTPYQNVVMYAYQTDHTGHYTKKGTETGVQKWHGHLHGWCKTDQNGRYEIRSIRPAPYPSNTMPAHIHAALRPEGKPAVYISDFVFKDDPLVTQQYLATIPDVGGTGIVDIRKNKQNTWTGTRDIVLKK
ncbi:intradiol ring-cleavage dioxygenase [Sabulibacter ruber]|uniref:dioxygenase family protein n=1 Tax=Sabulibacter ruber TaxID=2811901 RepID=UPI001A96DFE1